MNHYNEMESKKREIMLQAGELFLSQGYKKTTLRQIASLFNTSTGLITYYYPAKRDIAAELQQLQLSGLIEFVHHYVDQKNDPILFSAVISKLQWAVMTAPRFYRFQVDTMQEDIYTAAATSSGIETYKAIRDKYNLQISDQNLLLYGNYLASSLGRMLLLEADKGAFQVADIPNVLIDSSLGRIWGNEKQLEQVCKDADVITAQIIIDHTDILQTWAFIVIKREM